MEEGWTELENSLNKMLQSAEELWSLHSRRSHDSKMDSPRPLADSPPPSQTAASTTWALLPPYGPNGVAGPEASGPQQRLQHQHRSLPPTTTCHDGSPSPNSSLAPTPSTGAHRLKTGGVRRPYSLRDSPPCTEDFAYAYEESTPDSFSLSPSPPSSSMLSTCSSSAPVNRLLTATNPPCTSSSSPSPSSSSKPPPTTSASLSVLSLPSPSSEDYRRLLEMQSVSAMEWLRDTAFIRLNRMFRLHRGGKGLPTANAENGSAAWDDFFPLQRAAKRKLTANSSGMLPTLTAASHRYGAHRRMRVWSQNLMSKVRLVKALSNSNLVYNGVLPHNGVEEGADAAGGYDSLYGLPLAVVQARSARGSPLPRFAHDIMDYLVEHARQAEGVFRRNGVKLRIHEIKEQCGKLGVNDPISRDLVTQSQPHDLADALKQYFRDLPQCLMTNKVSAWLEQSATQDFPEETRFTALHYCVLLLPEENREALFILLRFLKRIADNSEWNQMNEENLATCLMPSLFRMPHSIPLTKSARRKTIGMPNEQERNAYAAIKQVLTRMIQDGEQLAMVPWEMWREMEHLRSTTTTPPAQRRSLEPNLDLEMPLRNGLFDFRDEYQRLFRRQHLKLQESYVNGWPEWQLERVFADGSQLFTLRAEQPTTTTGSNGSHKGGKVRESNRYLLPIRQFLLRVNNIPAPVAMVHSYLLHHRTKWERNVVETRKIGASGQNFDVIKVTYNSPTHPTLRKYAYLARRWQYASEEPRICTLIERSVVPKDVPAGSLKPRLHYYKSSFLIANDYGRGNGAVPASGHSQLNYLFCIDVKGKSPQWYERAQDEMGMEQMSRLREHFTALNSSRLRASKVSVNSYRQSRRETIV